MPSEATDTEAALYRILQSDRFRKNSSLRQLLEYLVTRSLRGQQNQIKEMTVAMDVFGRPKDFDSRIDKHCPGPGTPFAEAAHVVLRGRGSE